MRKAATAETMSPEDRRKRDGRYVLIVVGVALVSVVALVSFSMIGEGTEDTIDGPPMTGNAVGGGMALEGDIPEDAVCRDLPEGCTARPTPEQARQLEDGIAAVYPGVPEGKATDWSIYTCDGILEGQPEDSLVRATAIRFSGGSRPDPTWEQAQQILDVIEASGFCVAG